MYCKYCGKEIPDDGIFCPQCGKKQGDNDNGSIRIQLEKAQPNHYISTSDLQWKKPYAVRCVQLLFLAISLFFLVWGTVWCIKGGKIYNGTNNIAFVLDFSGEELDIAFQISEPLFIYVDFDFREYDLEHQLGYSKKWANVYKSTLYYEKETRDALREEYLRQNGYYDSSKDNKEKYYIELAAYSASNNATITERTTYYEYERYAEKYAKKILRKRILWIYIIPSIVLMIISIVWIVKIPFPKSKDGLPKDIADEIEKHSYSGFVIPKYAFYRKGNAYGIIDVSKYKASTPPIFTSVSWRQKNVSIDAELNDEQIKDLQVVTIVQKYKH